MSRIGKKVISIPEKVTVQIKDASITIQGPKGILSRSFSPLIEVFLNSDKHLEVKRKNNLRESRSLHGLTRTLIANMVKGVTEGFEKKLEILGLGYKAQLQAGSPGAGSLQINVGYTNSIQFELPKTIQAKVDGNTKITISGPDKELVGVTADQIRKLRLPEPYKGTGIRYEKEVIIRKAGKTAGGGGSTAAG